MEVAVKQSLIMNGTALGENSSSLAPVVSGVHKILAPDGVKDLADHTSMKFKTLKNSSTISIGRMTVLSSSISSGEKTIMGPESFSNGKEGATVKTPALISKGISVRNIKKVRMSTVAKRVPLINTIGNYSKLIPIPPSFKNPATFVTTSSSPSALKIQAKSSQKDKSILEAMLTSTAPNASNCPSLTTETSDLTSKVLPASPVTSSSNQLVSEPESDSNQTLHASKDDSMSELLQPSSKKSKQSFKVTPQRKAVLSFERGTTRLAVLEFRTVTMVDVGMQVFIPDSETNSHEGKDASCNQTSSAPAVSTGCSGSVQQPPVFTPAPQVQKQLIVLDTKNGKKLLAISNNVVNAHLGSKTMVVGGKPVKIQMEGSTNCNVNNIITKETSNASMSELLVHDANSMIPRSSANIKPSSVHSILTENKSMFLTVAPGNHKLTSTCATVVTATSSLSTDTVTTPSSVILSSETPLMQAPNNTLLLGNPLTSPCSVSSVKSQLHGSNKSSSFPEILMAKNQKSNVDSLIVSVNSPVQSTVSTTSENSFSHTNSVRAAKPSAIPIVSQADPNTSNSPILFSSPQIHTSSSLSRESVPVCTLPNTSPFFILLPNSLSEGNENLILEHEMGDGVDPNTFTLVNNMLHCQSSNQGPPPSKKRCLESIDVKSIPVQRSRYDASLVNAHSLKTVSSDDVPHCNAEHPKTKLTISNNSVLQIQKPKDFDSIQESSTPSVWNSFDSVMSSYAGGISKTGSHESISKVLRSAFIDFKNCLVFNSDGKLPIHIAVENNDYAAVKRQCIVLKARKASVDMTNSSDETPLQLALCCGNSSIAKLLIQQGADATIHDNEGNSTLHLAVAHADDFLETLLLSKQLNKGLLNDLNDEGLSALHLAAQLDKANAIPLLVEFGADIDLPDGKSGRTALYHAVERKHYKSQRALMHLGADMKGSTFTGLTPLNITRSDAIAQLTSCHTVAEVIDPATLLQTSKRRKIRRVN